MPQRRRLSVEALFEGGGGAHGGLKCWYVTGRQLQAAGHLAWLCTVTPGERQRPGSSRGGRLAAAGGQGLSRAERWLQPAC